jgi:hypothetical protein
MTPEQTYDRLERTARLLCQASLVSLRESRQHTLKLEAYVTKLREYDAAKLAAAKMPEELETMEDLRRATEDLNHARESLQRANEHRPSHSSTK